MAYSHPRLSLSEEVAKLGPSAAVTGSEVPPAGWEKSSGSEVTLQALGIVSDTAFHVRAI